MSQEKTANPQWKPTLQDIVLSFVLSLLFVGQIALCVLFYNYYSLYWLLYIGWAILAVSFILGGMARRSFEKEGRSLEGESWLRTRVVVDSGIYAVVRHPMYTSGILLILSLILISQHWLSAILGAPIIVYFYISMLNEERSNTERFGDDYIQYMRRVPRMNFLVWLMWLLRRRKIIVDKGDDQRYETRLL